jgi:NADH-quinone oxidoreductase chain I
LEAAVLGFDRFGLGIAKGLVVTMRHLIRPPITLQYPEEKLVPSKRIRGNMLIWYENKCTGCATCAKACPQGNIEISTHPENPDKYAVDRFRVDMGRCMSCGLCVEACPFDALYMGRAYERARYRRGDLVLDKLAMAMNEEHQPSGYFHSAIEKLMPKQTLLLYWDREDGQKLKKLPLRARKAK